MINPQFDYVESFEENGLAQVNLNGKYGWIDTNGNYVINPQFDDTWGFAENGLAKVELNGKWGYIDTTGNYVINPQFDQINFFAKNGLAAVQIGEKCGYINHMGELVIQPEFDWFGTGEYTNSENWEESFYTEADFYDDGYAVVKVGNVFGIIDSQGNYIANPQFSQVRF